MADGSMPVRLAYATPQAFSPGGGVSVSYTYAVVKVANLGYDKSVVLHRYGPSPADYPLTWLEWRGDHDVFGTPPPSSVPTANEFAVSYTVNGQTYWDSLGGGNYHVDTLKTVVGGNVSLVKATTELGLGPYERVVRGELYVNNLSPVKDVGIRLSADGGSTWQDVPAFYVGTSTEAAYVNLGVAELWRFQTPLLSPTGPTFRFAAYYRDRSSGATYWDNNFEQDYRLGTTPGSDVR
jgi:carbohydrate/starch-binding protein with CBM21 domain